MLHSHFFLSAYITISPKNLPTFVFFHEKKHVLRSKEASMQLDMNELILQAPLSLGAVGVNPPV